MKLVIAARLALAAALTATLGYGSARAQDPAQREALEPRADTSATRVGSAVEAAPAAPAAANGSGPKPAPPPKRDGATQRKPDADRVDLDTTTVTGNQELPKVMYIVPWKKSDIGDLSGKPPGSLLDEVLAPVDRDVFRREVRYYDALKAQPSGTLVPAGGPATSAAGAAAPPGESGRQVEK
jgi:hypothetical protein